MRRGAVIASQFADHAPELARLTEYDESHLTDYLRLLDAEDEGTDWREAAAHILGINAAAEPQRAKAMHESHLARARWMTEFGYALLLGRQRPSNR
jgi:predicted secreted protein